MHVIRIAVVSSLPAMRAGLRLMLSGNGELQVTAEAGSLEALEVFSPSLDILLLTGEVFSTSGMHRLLSQVNPDMGAEGELAVLVLAQDGRMRRDLEKLPLRAWGLLSQDATAEELAAGLRALAQGLWVADPLLMKAGLPLLWAEDSKDDPGEPLTERESQVLQLLARGLANKQIASVLGISEHTVKFHVSSIYSRLGVTNRAEAVRRGIQQGWVVL